MTNPPANPSDTPIQFDRAVSKDGAAKAPGVICSMCNKTVGDRYYTLGDQPVCSFCKSSVERDAAKAKGGAVFMKSSLYGFGGALAGAILYYAVLKILDLQIGLVAIACGYMVGYAMRKGANGWGGRRFQIAAAGLTYLSVGMAYLPIAVEGAFKAENSAKAAADSVLADSIAASTDSSAVANAGVADSGTVALAGDPVIDSSTAVANDSSATSDSTATASPDSAGPTGATTDETPGIGALLIALIVTFAFAMALPILVILGSMPGGLISALIMLFGIQQAWKMTAGQDVEFHGPLTVAK